jgi:hypothetical protein
MLYNDGYTTMVIQRWLCNDGVLDYREYMEGGETIEAI